MATNLVTASTKRLSGANTIVLSLIFGVVYAGLGESYLGFVDPHAWPDILALVLLMAIFGWLVFLILLGSRWKTVSILSFPSHVIVTLAIGIICSVLTWPPSIAVLYSDSANLMLVGIYVLFPALVALLTYAAYALALRALDGDKRSTH